MSSNFITENPELHDYTCNQNILVKRSHLKHLVGYQDKPEDVAKTQLHTNWYPYVNSYYQYAEDYDAVNRVEHLLHERHSAEVDLGLKLNDPKDGYIEKTALVRYLRSKPTSFVILGKPEIGERKLGKLVADYWRSVYIHPEDLIREEIECGSRAGVCIEYNLRCGRAVSIDVILRLLEKRMSTQTVQHRGFVLCGFPLVSNGLFTEDPVSSESAVFNVHDIFEDVIDSAFEQIEEEAAKNVSRTSKTGSIEDAGEMDEEELEAEVRQETGTHEVKCKTDLGAQKEDVCYQSYVHADDVDQMNFIFNLCSKSNYIIVYLKCANEEVINVRKHNRIDALTMELVNLLRDRTDNVRTFYEVYPEAEEIDQGFIVNQKLLRFQRDFPAHVNAQLERYRYESQTVIEKFILLHDPDYVIKLDGRTAPHRTFQALKTRLRVLPISQSLIPEPLNDEYVEELGEGRSPPPKKNYDEMMPEEWFNDLHEKKILGPLYKWSLSDWGYLCPVAMYNGSHINGDPNFAVQFTNKVYFLSDEEAYVNFLRNPRPYLLPPFPKPPCKVYIIGPRRSGKSALAEFLTYFLGGEILNPNKTAKDYLQVQHDEYLNKLCTTAINEALQMLKRMRREAFEEQEAARLAGVEEFYDEMCSAIKRYVHCHDCLNNFRGTEWTSLPSPRSVYKSDDIQDCEQTIAILYSLLNKHGFPMEDTEALAQISEDENLISEYLPDELKAPVQFQYDLISINHSFVQDYLQTAMIDAEMKMNAREINSSVLAESFKYMIDQIDGKMKQLGTNGGWIFDGFPLDLDLFTEMRPKYMADIIYVLRDTSPKHRFLKERTCHTVTSEFLLHLLQTSGSVKSLDFLHVLKRDDDIILDEERRKDDEKHYSDYDLNMEVILKYMGANSIPYVEIVITNKTVEDLLEEVYHDIEARHCERATLFTAEDRVKEVEDYGERVEDEEIGGEGAEDNADRDKFFAENRRLGMTDSYCPIALSKHFVLWKGKEEYAAKYLNELYVLSSENARNDFLRNANRCMKMFKSGSLKTLPPPRICITGTKKIGKTTLAKNLSRNLGLYYADFEEMLKNCLPDEETLKLYLINDQPIPEHVMKKILLPYWFEKPKNATGFVLDGFPRRPSDVDFMCVNFAIPDLIIELTCPEHILFARLLDILLEEWQVQMAAEKAVENAAHENYLEQWRSARNAKRRFLIDEKRNARYDAKLHKLQSIEEEHIGEEEETESEQSMVSYRSVEEAADLQDIEAQLEEELPEPVWDDNWETEDVAAKRLEAAIEDGHAGEVDFLSLLQEHCVSEQIPWVQVGADLDPTRLCNCVLSKVMKIKNRSLSILERIYDVSVEMAEKLLEQGYYFLSRFGKSCPVQIYENYNRLQVFLPQEAKFQLYPLIHKRYIYFVAGQENRKKFKENVLKYIEQEHCYLPMEQMRVAIIGPPRCGKSTISERLQYEYGLKHVSIGKAVRYVQKTLATSKLAERVEELLRKGECLTDDLSMSCVEAMSYESRSVALGFVMDGFPNNVVEVKELAKLNIVPHLIIDLRADLAYLYEYMDQQEHKPLYSKKFIGHRYSCWESYAEYFRQWVDREYQNLGKVPIEPSKWKMWRNTKDLLLAVTSEIKYYYTHRNKDRPLRISNLLVTPMEFVHRNSSFKNYCPCCLFHSNCLSCGGNPPDRSGLLQYHYEYYWLCPDHIEEFIDNPEAYLGPNIRHSLPLITPTRSTTNSAPEDCYSSGNCVVCIAELRELIPGNPDYAVEYGQTIYIFNTIHCLNKFMSVPGKYSAVSKSFRGTKYPSMEPNNLPSLGFLEQFDADQVVRAVLDTSLKRPIIPGLDAKASSLIYLGLYLKSKNPNTPSDKIHYYVDGLEQVVAKRNALMDELAELKKTINPYLHYEEPLGTSPLTLFRESSKASSTYNSMVYMRSLSISEEGESCFLTSESSTDNVVQTIIEDLLDNVTCGMI